MDFTMKEMREYAKQNELNITLYGKRKQELFDSIVSALKDIKKQTNQCKIQNNIKNDLSHLKIRIEGNFYENGNRLYYDKNVIRLCPDYGRCKSQLRIENTLAIKTFRGSKNEFCGSSQWKYEAKRIQDKRVMEFHGITLTKNGKITFNPFKAKPCNHEKHETCKFQIIAQRKASNANKFMTLENEFTLKWVECMLSHFCIFFVCYNLVTCAQQNTNVLFFFVVCMCL